MPDAQNTDESLLVRSAKKIGATAGRIASALGADTAEEKPAAGEKSAKGKLPKKNKSRLPRRLKKAQQKAAAKQG